MQALIRVVCPYCQNRQRFQINLCQVEDWAIVFCDPEEAGCDSYYAVFTEVTIRVKEKKIEGEEENASSQV